MDLSDIYFDPRNPGSFGGVEKLFRQAKLKYPSVKRDQVRDWLASRFEYSLFKDARKKWKRNKIYVSRIDEQWEIDLLDYTNFSRQNSGVKYLLVIIDVFSKYLFALPLKTKKADEIVAAFVKLFRTSGRIPSKIRSDRGLEFENSKFRQMCKEYNINFFTTTNSTIKCAVVERVNRTLRNRLERLMAHRGRRRYIDALDKIVQSYNRTMHRSIRMPPGEVSLEDEPIVFENLYGAPNMLDLARHGKLKPKFEIGEQVRQKYDLKPLEKSYYQRWTDIVYKIDKVLNKLFKPQFVLSLEGRKFKRTFYPEELQKVKVDDDSVYLVEKIIRYRTKDKQRQALVKWKGYPSTHNEWIPMDQIQNL